MNKQPKKFFLCISNALIWLINQINEVFDYGLTKFKSEYENTVEKILPGKSAPRDIVYSEYRRLIDAYYDHKKDRRTMFNAYLTLIPTSLVGMFFLKTGDYEVLYNLIDYLVIAFTIFTIFQFSIFRRKILKKTIQIKAFQKRYAYLSKDFILTSSFSYSQETDSGINKKYLSTTNIYRMTVILVLSLLVILLFI